MTHRILIKHVGSLPRSASVILGVIVATIDPVEHPEMAPQWMKRLAGFGAAGSGIV